MTDQADPRGSDDDLAFSYDNLDRPIETTAVDLDAAITTQYDALGRRTALDDGTGTTSFSYDALGRITQVDAPTTGTVGYGYNGRGDRTRLTYPDSSAVFSSYFDDGQLQDVVLNSTTLASYGYDIVGRLTQQTRANGAVTSYSYDYGDRLRNQTTRTHGAISSQFAYDVDLTGQRTASRETLAAPAAGPLLDETRVLTYTYDGLQRLTGADTATTDLPVGTGLQGVYFNDMSLTTAVLTRTDRLVDFDWGDGAPNPALPNDGFSVRWMGQIVPRYSETYTFYTIANELPSV